MAEAESGPGRIAIVAARDEGDRIGATLRSLAQASPGIGLWVTTCGTSRVANAVSAAQLPRCVTSK